MNSRPALVVVALALGWTTAAQADLGTSGSAPLTATARLDFTVNIDKFMMLRIGAAGAGVSTVGFALAPAIPGGPATPVAGNSRPGGWNRSTPTFTVVGTNATLPVEVASNAGQVTLRATVSTPLSNGATTIPMSDIGIVSSDATNLPAPTLPDSGTGATVNVTGGPGNSLVTARTANWTFSYLNSTNAPAGTYTGTITFTASAP